ncbi:hypothetical protein EfmAA610_31380 (plasmid) [Enterococcus faecium]|nr:hypothetical protein EfmAA610_31380 [Enterococcus faecium]
MMLNDLRGVKEKIDDLDSEISTSGSLKPTFGDLLTLQKYMIALSTTYKASGHLDTLTTSVVFLVFKNKLIIFTKQKLKFIPELLWIESF